MIRLHGYIKQYEWNYTTYGSTDCCCTYHIICRALQLLKYSSTAAVAVQTAVQVFAEDTTPPEPNRFFFFCHPPGRHHRCAPAHQIILGYVDQHVDLAASPSVLSVSSCVYTYIPHPLNMLYRVAAPVNRWIFQSKRRMITSIAALNSRPDQPVLKKI